MTLITWEYVCYLGLLLAAIGLVAKGVEYLVQKNDEENPWKRRYNPDGSFSFVTAMEDLKEESSDKPQKEMNTNTTNQQEIMEQDTNRSVPNEQEPESRTTNLPTRSLLLEVLRSMGGRISFDNEDGVGSIYYEYQGATFLFDADDDLVYIVVWYPCFHSIPLEDIDQIAAMRKVINNLHLTASCTLLYTIEAEEGVVNIHCRKHMLFIPSITNISDYLSATLLFFFETGRDFMLEFEREKANQQL